MLSSIEALAWNLNSPDTDWKDKISSFEGNIDYCNLNYNDVSLSLEERQKNKKDLDNLLSELKKHIEFKIDKNLTDEDIEYRY